MVRASEEAAGANAPAGLLRGLCSVSCHQRATGEPLGRVPAAESPDLRAAFTETQTFLSLLSDRHHVLLTPQARSACPGRRFSP